MGQGPEATVGPRQGSKPHVVTLRDVGVYLLVFLLIPLPIVLISVGPLIYNRHFSAVGRCYTQVLRVDTCGEAETVMRETAKRHRDRRQLEFTVERPAKSGILGPVKGSAYLSLYDWVLLDDVQLGVLCDERGRIVRRDYIGD